MVVVFSVWVILVMVVKLFGEVCGKFVLRMFMFSVFSVCVMCSLVWWFIEKFGVCLLLCRVVLKMCMWLVLLGGVMVMLVLWFIGIFWKRWNVG